MRLLKRVVILGVILLVVVVAIGAFVVANLDTIVEKGVEKGGTMILGVNTELDGASVSLLRGKAGLEGLKLGSPEGFEADGMFKLNEVQVDLDVRSLRSDEIVISEILIDGPEITLEFSGGKTNWGTVLERLKGEPKEEEKDAPKMRIDHVLITDASIRIAGIPLIGDVSVPLPRVEINDLKSTDGTGLTARKALSSIFTSMYAGIIQAVQESEVAEHLGAIAGEAGALLKGTGHVIEGVGGAVKDVLEGGAEQAGGLIKGILGGDEKDKKDE